MQAVSKWFPDFVCHGQHSLPGKDSWPQVENLHTQTAEAGRSTVRECRLQSLSYAGCLRRSQVPSVETESTLTANLDRGLQLEKIGLTHKYLFCCQTELTNFLLRELYLLSRSSISDVQESIDYIVQNRLLLQGQVLVSLCCTSCTRLSHRSASKSAITKATISPLSMKSP